MKLDKRISAFSAVAAGIALLALVFFSADPVHAGKDGLAAPHHKADSVRRYNRLVHEKSPYLLQHAENPIHWFPWGPLAFETARRENKPIFLSIGYSTCHWCHVMENESFDDPQVAQRLNDAFICIKVDREELPDVDQMYMSVVNAMTGRGGWPMTVVMTPERIPFFGATYLPREQLLATLTDLAAAWENEPQKIAAVGKSVMAFLEKSAAIKAGGVALEDALFQDVFHKYERELDPEHGGFGLAPKFPPALRLQVLLRIALRSGDARPLESVVFTLRQMARGAVYDHLGGGFHRYTIDRAWRTPHFEKMLYSQALLASVYLEAFQATRDPLFEAVARGTLDYVLRELTGEEGGFHSAQDADSEGEEGRHYVWTDAELKSILDEAQYRRFIEVYGVTREGNFGDENKRANVLYLKNSAAWKDKSAPEIRAAHAALTAARKQRPPPLKDDKVITAWNGLMLDAFARAHQVLGEARYLAAAQNAARFIAKHLYSEGKLLRRYRDGEARHPAPLDDYAYLVQGLIRLYESDFDPAWLEWAVKLQKKQDELFWDPEAGGYFLSEKNAHHLPVRGKTFADGARPNSNAVAALNGIRLHGFTLEKDFQEKATTVLTLAAARVIDTPRGHAQMLLALDYYLDRAKEIVVVGPAHSPEKNKILKIIRTGFFPNKILGYVPNGAQSRFAIFSGKLSLKEETTVYVCENSICKFPTTDPDQVLTLIEDRKTYTLNGP